MPFRIAPRSTFAAGLGLRVGAIGALSVLVVVIGMSGHLLLSLPILVSLNMLMIADLVRHLRRVDEALAESLETLVDATQNLPSRPIGGLLAYDRALRTLADQRRGERTQTQREQNRAQALLDTVAAGLLIVGEGPPRPANRAAHSMLARQGASRLDGSTLTEDALSQIRDLPPGGRALIPLKDGAAILALSATFSTPGARPVRLVSLQNVAHDLEAVEDRAWRDLARVLAHEIMNSLTPINAIAESAASRLRGKAGVAEARAVADGLDIVARRAEGLMAFVSRYREFAEVPELERSRVSIGDLVSCVAQLMSSPTELAQLELRTDPADLMAEVDPQLVEQALINLVKNALDATRNTQSPRIAVEAWAQDDDLHLRVRDNGCGLPDGEAERIFIPFFTTKAHGAGIGLSLVRRIALAHQGHASATRAAGGGAEIVVTFPGAVRFPKTCHTVGECA